MSKYGTNSAQVERFVQCARALTDDQWAEVVRQQRRFAVVFGEFDHVPLELEAYKAHGADKANKMLSTAMRDAGLDRGQHDRWTTGLRAILALLYPTNLWIEQFSAAYGPFEWLIPVHDLGAGEAPNIIPLPPSLGQRFVMRLHNFQNQRGVVKTAFGLQQAVGVERIDAAVDAALGSVADIDEMLVVQDQLAQLCASEVEELTRIFRMVASKISAPEERIQAQRQFYQSQREAFRLAAVRAAAALMAKAFLQESDFALLYLPFLGFVPPEDLIALD